ncbi:MAG: hypothetical protein P8X70_00260 [Nanoarchaeota archaeon]|jgi:hypothetical protein
MSNPQLDSYIKANPEDKFIGRTLSFCCGRTYQSEHYTFICCNPEGKILEKKILSADFDSDTGEWSFIVGIKEISPKDSFYQDYQKSLT